MTSRGFDLPELPEFPPRLPPFLQGAERTEVRKVRWAVLEPIITGDLDAAILRVEHAYRDLGWVINHPPEGLANPMRLDE